MSQGYLKWGSINLVLPSGTVSGYERKSFHPVLQDVEEVAIPGTSGRFQIRRGYGQCQQTSRSWTFECEQRFSDESSVIGFENALNTAIMNQNLETLQYTLLRGSSSTIQNCSLDNYESTELWLDASGYFYLRFNVSFSEWL